MHHSQCDYGFNIYRLCDNLMGQIMTDKVKEGLKDASVIICVNAKDGYSSQETFGSTSPLDVQSTLLNAVDEIHRMLLLNGCDQTVLAHRLFDTVKRVVPEPKKSVVDQVLKKIAPQEPGYPGPHFQD
jgi:hypothetical protein